MLAYWKRDLLDNTRLSCVPACVYSRGLDGRLHRAVHCKLSSERSLGFSCSKLSKNSHWIVISLYDAELLVNMEQVIS